MKRNIAALISSAAAAQVLSVLTAPLLTRLYRPEDFGSLAAFAAIVSIIAPVAAFRLEAAVPIARRERSAALLLLTALTSVWAVAWAVALGLVAATILEFIAINLSIAIALPLGIGAVGTYTAGASWALRHRQYREIAGTRILQVVTQTVAQVGLAVIGVGGLGLIVGFVFGQASGALRLLRPAVPHVRRALQRRPIPSAMRLVLHYRQFAVMGTPSALLMLVSLHLPALAIVAMFGHAQAGFFALGYRLMATPAKMIASSIGQVYQAELSQVVRHQSGSVSTLYGTFTRRLLLVGLAVFIPAAVVAPKVAGVVLGPNWVEVGRYVQFMAPMMLLQFIVSPVSATLTVLRRQSSELLLNAARLFVVVAVFAFAHVLRAPALYTIGLYSAAMCVLYVGHLAMYHRIVRDPANLYGRPAVGSC